MIQKLIKVGNSYAVTIPRWFINELNLKDGDKVRVIHDEITKKVILQFKKNQGKEFLIKI